MANDNIAEFRGDNPGAEPAGRKGRVKAAADTALEKVTNAYGDARDTMADAYLVARDKAAEAGRRAADGIEENPAVAVVGGLALGVVAAALLPQSKRETKALGAVGGKINKAAKGAVDAAREAGKAKIGELGLVSARDNVLKIVEGVTGGASS